MKKHLLKFSNSISFPFLFHFSFPQVKLNVILFNRNSIILYPITNFYENYFLLLTLLFVYLCEVMSIWNDDHLK